MARGFNAANLAIWESSSANMLMFVELRLDESASPQVIERFWTGLGTISWGGNTWYGMGDLWFMDSIAEGTGLSPKAVRLGLSGIDTDALNLALGVTQYYKAPALIYLGAFDSNMALAADPDLVFSGYIDSVTGVTGSDEGEQVHVNLESELRYFQKSRKIRWTDNQLQQDYPGDLALQYVAKLQKHKVVWRGKAETRLGSGGSRSSGGATLGGRFTGSRN